MTMTSDHINAATVFRREVVGKLFTEMHARLTWPVDRPAPILVQRRQPGIGVIGIMFDIAKLLGTEAVLIPSKTEVDNLADFFERDGRDYGFVVIDDWDQDPANAIRLLSTALTKRQSHQTIIISSLAPDEKDRSIQELLQQTLEPAHWYGLTTCTLSLPKELASQRTLRLAA